MNVQIDEQHKSAVEFQNLSSRVVHNTQIPGPETQVYEQDPVNGLYYRHSGRLLTSQPEGDFIRRARSGFKTRELFELQRSGQVSRQASTRMVTPRRINPVYRLDLPEDCRYVAIRWVDEEGLHEAIPQNKNGMPVSVSVISWLGDTVMSNVFSKNPSDVYDRKTKSAESDDPTLELFYKALRAYRHIQPSRTAIAKR